LTRAYLNDNVLIDEAAQKGKEKVKKQEQKQMLVLILWQVLE